MYNLVILRGKMRLMVVLLVVTITYAKRSRTLKGVKVTKKDSPLVEELISRADITNDSKRYKPVLFGHISKAGFNPNETDPVDGLEIDSIYVKDSELVQQLIKNGYKNIVPITKKKPLGFASPKDELYFGNIEKLEDLIDKNETFLNDFVGQQRKNINMSPEIKRMPNLKDIIITRKKYDTKSRQSSLISGTESKQKYFERTSFDLAGNRSQSNLTVNWTTCDEFRRKPNFHPKDVVNIDWVPFYVWTENELKASSVVHKFTYPTRKLVKEYKDTYSPYINKTIDWTQPKLVLKEMTEMLLVAGDRRGLFNVIPHLELPKRMPADANVPCYQIRMKKVESYLALMMCDIHYAVIMAVSGKEPQGYKNTLAEVAKLKFRGTGTVVIRDLENERENAELERQYKLKREKDKFIYVDY